jgi:iron-sulfur cluster assembly accessory protein
MSMSAVQQFDPVQLVGITEVAVAHLCEQLVSNGSAVGVRLSTKPSGCSGYKYQLDLVTEPKATDLQQQINEHLTLFIDPDSVPLLKGTVIDLIKQGVNFSIQFHNPNATGECGCGESFAVN